MTTKTWFADGDVAFDNVGSIAAIHQSAAFTFFALLLGTKTGVHGTSGAPPVGSRWTCYYSCNSVTAGAAADGVDHFATFADWVRGSGGAPFSWYCARSPTTIAGALAVSWFWLVVYDGGSDGKFSVYKAKTPFTGGTTTARPTSPDELRLANGSADTFMFESTALNNYVAHRITDAVGNFTFLVSRAGGGKFFGGMFCHALSELRGVGDVYPVVGGCLNDNGNSRGIGTANSSQMTISAAAGGFRMRGPSGIVDADGGGIMPVSAEFTNSTTPNVVNGNWDEVPAYFQWFKSGSQSVRGRLTDFWIIGNMGNGLRTPVSSPTHISCNGMLIPNDGAAFSV